MREKENRMFQRIYQFYRFYFVRKKSPLSYIWWQNILHRHVGFEGSYQVSIATVDEPDADISFSYGAPSDNYMSLKLYDNENNLYHKVKIPLSYRSMMKIQAGFNEASREIRKNIRESKS